MAAVVILTVMLFCHAARPRLPDAWRPLASFLPVSNILFTTGTIMGERRLSALALPDGCYVVGSLRSSIGCV